MFAFLEIIVMPIALVLSVKYGIILFFNIHDAFVYFNEPDYYCAKCGELISPKTTKCPKCKTILKEGKVNKQNVSRRNTIITLIVGLVIIVPLILLIINAIFTWLI